MSPPFHSVNCCPSWATEKCPCAIATDRRDCSWEAGRCSPVRCPRNVTSVTDPRSNVALTQIFDLATRSLRSESIDAGKSRVIYDAAGLPRESRDEKGALVLNGYDDALRPTHLWARDDGNESIGLRVETIYGDDSTNGPTNPEDTNHNGRIYEQYDEAGKLEFVAYDLTAKLPTVASRSRSLKAPAPRTSLRFIRSAPELSTIAQGQPAGQEAHHHRPARAHRRRGLRHVG